MLLFQLRLETGQLHALLQTPRQFGLITCLEVPGRPVEYSLLP